MPEATATIMPTAMTTFIPPIDVLDQVCVSTDHKVIGIQFLFSGLIFMVLGGLLAMAMRLATRLAWKPVPILSQPCGPTRRWATRCRRSFTTNCSHFDARDDHDLLRGHPA